MVEEWLSGWRIALRMTFSQVKALDVDTECSLCGALWA